MKVNIVTVFQTANYGSFMQAKALYTLIDEKYEPYLVDAKVRRTFKDSVFPTIRSFIKGIITFNFKYAGFNLRRLKALHNNFSSVKIIKLSKAKGAFVFGSDEIWNFARAKMANYPVLMGKGVDAIAKLSYAPSVNGCDIELLKNKGLGDALEEFLAVSVRDEYTNKVITELTGRADIQTVLDPTLLFDREYYKKNYPANKRKKLAPGYIAVYIFRPTPEIINTIKEVARITNKKLVSTGFWYTWCDEQVVSELPFEYFMDADFVITNTFHGNAFSINLGKQFVNFAPNSKVKELLNNFGLSDRTCDVNSVDKIVEKLKEKINYGKVDSLLDEKRCASKNYLWEALKKAENNDKN